MGKLTSQIVAILSVLLVVSTPLAVLGADVDYSDAGYETVSNTNNQSNYTDETWKDVSDESSLRAALGDESIKLVRLTGSITLTSPLTIDRSVLLNLNKKTLSTNFTTTETSAVKITDAVTIEYGTVSSNKCDAIEVSGNGYLTLVTADVTATAASSSAITLKNGGSLVVDAILSNGISGNAHAVSMESSCAATINAGTFKSTTGNTIDATGNVKLTINGGTFSNGGSYLSLYINGVADANILINSGKFEKGVDTYVSAVEIWGGEFCANIIQGTESHDNYTIYGGAFKQDVSAKIATGCAKTTVTISSVTYNYVYQENSIKVNSKYFKTIAEAYADEDTGNLDTIELLKSGTYIFNMNVIAKSTKIVGKEGENIILDAYNTPQYASGQNMYLKNVTLKRANESYLGFLQSTTETYVNVTFTTFFCVYAGSNASFTGCTFLQPDINNYSVQVYSAMATTFTDCSFVNGGKSVLIYTEGDSKDGKVTFNNCTFVDKCFAKDKAAVEIHTEYYTGAEYIADRSGWTVDFNSCAITGYYEGTLCESNLWNTVNNDTDTIPQTKSLYSVINIDGYEEYPNPAIYAVSLKDGETVTETVSAKFGKMMDDVTVPGKAGYVFNGYYNTVTNIQYFDENGKCVRVWDSRAAGELSAVWTLDTKHKVTYTANGAEGSVPTQPDVQEGTLFTLANNTLTLTDYGFVGWSDGYRTYNAGEKILMGASDMTFSAVWAKNYEPITRTPHSVVLTILDANGNSVSAAKIAVDGKDAGVTDLDGAITVSLTDETHMVNIALEPSLNQTKTIVVDSETTKKDIVLSDYNVKTVVDTTGTNTKAAVNNLDEVAESLKGTADSVTVTVKIDDSTVAIKNAESDISETKKLSERSDCVFVDVSLFVDKGTGAEKVTEITKTLEIIIPFNSSGMKTVGDKAYIVYHCHETTEGTIYTEIKENKTVHDPFTYYVEDGNMHIFLKEFSGIAINYTPAGSVSVVYDDADGSEAAPVQSAVVENTSFTVKGYSGIKEGYEFGGWSYGGKVYKEGDVIDVTTNDVKLTAVWNPVGGSEKTDVSWMAYLIILIAIVEYAAIFYYCFGRKRE